MARGGLRSQRLAQLPGQSYRGETACLSSGTCSIGMPKHFPISFASSMIRVTKSRTRSSERMRSVGAQVIALMGFMVMLCPTA